MELLGHTLGPYQVLEKIGRGGMAEVYKGFHPALNRYVAIKIVGQFLEADPSFAQRFQREAQAIASLRHPNIVQIFDFGVQSLGSPADTTPYLVMEYIHGRDLRAEMNQRHAAGKPFTHDEILHLLSQVADALDYAHQHGVVHRDVKPGNILITDDGRAILTDFGLAMLSNRASQLTSGHSFGTPEYIAPEQAIDSRAASPQSDIYSLGVILYEMVSGCLPFQDESPLSLALKHINQQPTPLRTYVPNLPGAVEKVILRALAKEPADRFPSARAMLDALEKAWLVPAGAASQSSPGENQAAGPTTSASLPGRVRASLPLAFGGRALVVVGLAALLVSGMVGLFTFSRADGRIVMALATATSTPTATALPTATPSPAATATALPTHTATHTPTPQPSSTSTPTPTATPTVAPSDTPTTTPSRTVTDTPIPPAAPTASPGREDLYNRILFKTDRAGAVEVYSMKPDGSDQQPVLDGQIYNELASLEPLSPNRDRQIVVRTEGNAELWLVTMDFSENEWRITYSEYQDYDPAWSPAGDLIAFVSEQTGNGDIYISTPLGFDMRRITFNEDAHDRHPSWSPNGRYLAFWSDQRFNLRQIYVYDIWTGETNIIGSGPFNDWDPLWVK
jgi:serine/threonine protein kinase